MLNPSEEPQGDEIGKSSCWKKVLRTEIPEYLPD